MPEFTIHLPETLVPLLNRKAKEKNESPESCLASIVAVSLGDEQEAAPALQQLEDLLEERDKGPFVPLPQDWRQQVMARAREHVRKARSAKSHA
jgi:hypothetical protein